MSGYKRGAFIAMLVSAVLAALLTIAVLVGSPALLEFDARVFTVVRSWADPLNWPVRISAVVGALTSPVLSVLWTAVIAGVLWWRNHRVFAATLVCSGLLGAATSQVVKILVDRTRPEMALLHRRDLTLSFPSGHAMAGIYVYALLGVLLFGLARGRPWVRAIGSALIIFGPLIGVSRVVLGVHWPSDVLGGWAYGLTVALACSVGFWAALAAAWRPRAEGGELAASESEESSQARA